MSNLKIETEIETAISLKIETETEIFSRFLYTSGIFYPESSKKITNKVIFLKNGGGRRDPSQQGSWSVKWLKLQNFMASVRSRLARDSNFQNCRDRDLLETHDLSIVEIETRLRPQFSRLSRPRFLETSQKLSRSRFFRDSR